MDAPEAELDIKLQKVSADFIADFDRSLHSFLWEPDRRGGSKVRSRVRAKETFRLTSTLLDPFQELPQLLDPYLPKWIPMLAEAFLKHLQTRHRGKTLSSRSKLLVSVDNAISKILYTFCKIRGEKVIVRFLNVETKYLELLLVAIEESEQASSDDDGDGDDESLGKWSWEERYVVLLWLSHLLLAPFDLSTISSVDLQDITIPEIPGMKWPENLPAITVRLIPLAIKYLRTPGKERDAAKALLVRMATRRDMQKLGVLESLVHWSLACLRLQKDKAPETTYFYLGVLSFLAGVLRSSSDTSDMNKYLASIFYSVHAIATGETELSKTIVSFALARKMILKVLRTVIVLLLRQIPQDMVSTELTEVAIGYLLESVADNDTPVRLAASKALSIVTLKLDSDMASEVVEAVLESLNRNVLWSKSTAKPTRDLSAINNLEWHGLMLTLSHLLYRRSPPAGQLSDIVHALLLGLSFEQRSLSGGSVGSNVRDAACFGVWALARRYSTEELLAIPTHSVFAAKAHPPTSSILQVLATELVIAATLDPTGNIRRGASAALQELVGRHPDTVEQGIWLVQAVDYHAVARRSRAVEEVTLKATKLASQYGEAVMDTLLGWRGIGDLDAPSRRVCGHAYGLLSLELSSSRAAKPFDQFRTSIELITERLAALQPRQVEERHGLLLCYASVLNNLPTLVSRAKDGLDLALMNEILSSLTAILKGLKGSAYRRPELIVEAASRLVVSSLPILQIAGLGENLTDGLQTGEQYLSLDNTKGYPDLVSKLDSSAASSTEVAKFILTLKENIPTWLNRNEVETIEPASAAALTLLLFSKPEARQAILAEWADLIQIQPTSRTAAHGNGYFYVMTMAQPLAELLEQDPAASMDMACKAIMQRWNWDREVDSRVAVLQSLTQSRIFQEKPLIFLNLVSDGLNDYTINARGDVGSHVRVQALRAVRALWKNIGQAAEHEQWVQESVKTLFLSALRLSAEKLDRVRPEAQSVVSLVLEESYAKSFREMTFSSKSYFETLLGLHAAPGLHVVIADLAKTDTLSWLAALMAGFVTSADTGNEDLVIASRAALCDFCTANVENLNLVCTALLQNLKAHQGYDRITVPTLEIIAFLFHMELFPESNVDFRSLCLHTQKASYKTGNVRKIEACIRVYGGVATVPCTPANEAGVREAKKRLGALLYHPWPRVRSTVVDELWNLFSDDKSEGTGEKFKGVDWGKAGKSEIKAVVKELQLV